MSLSIILGSTGIKGMGHFLPKTEEPHLLSVDRNGDEEYPEIWGWGVATPQPHISGRFLFWLRSTENDQNPMGKAWKLFYD